jgi:hypothetical protein
VLPGHTWRELPDRRAMSHDLAIARSSRLRPITEVAEQAGIPLTALDFHGKHIAKLERDYTRSLRTAPTASSSSSPRSIRRRRAKAHGIYVNPDGAIDGLF